MRDTLDGQDLAGRIRATYRRLAETLARGIAKLRSVYRPERHYMRGRRSNVPGRR